MKEYAFDIKLDAALRINAPSYTAAVAMLKTALNCAEVNLGETEDGQTLLAEATMNEEPSIFEVDEEEAVICTECGAVEGEPEWGTVGDGYDGKCANCGDAAEGEEE